MTPAPIDPRILLQREVERQKRLAYDSLRRLREVSDELISTRRELAELRRVHLGELRYGGT